MKSVRLITLLVFGVLLGISSLYIALKLGFAVGVSLLTVIFMRGFERIGYSCFPSWMVASKKDYGYFLAFTTGMSFSTVTLLSTILAALVLQDDFDMTMKPLILWVVSLNVTGTFLAWSFRKKLVEVPFPSASAAAVLVENSEKTSAQKPFWVSFLGAGLWIWLKDVMAWIPQSIGIVSLSPMLVGLGGLLGFATSLSFFLGGLFFFLPEAHFLGGSREQIWFSVGAIITAVLCEFLTPLPKFQLRIPEINKRSLRALSTAIIVSMALYWLNFPTGVIALMVTCLLVWPMAFLASKVTGETDVTPIGALGKLVILLFAWFPGAASVMSLTGQVIGPAAASADFSSDLRCGVLLKCDPAVQLKYQLAGAVIGPIVFVPIFFSLKALVGTDVFPAPAAVIWNQFIEMLETDWVNISFQLRINVVAGVVVATVYHLLRKKWGPKWPSPVPFCIAVLLDFGTTNAIFVGGIMGVLLQKRCSPEQRLLLWSGLLTGEGVLMIILLLGL